MQVLTRQLWQGRALGKRDLGSQAASHLHLPHAGVTYFPPIATPPASSTTAAAAAARKKVRALRKRGKKAWSAVAGDTLLGGSAFVPRATARPRPAPAPTAKAASAAKSASKKG